MRLATEYVDLLPSPQFDNSPKVQAFLLAFLKSIQRLQESLTDYEAVTTNIDLAYGKQLDIIGSLLGAVRGSLDDIGYRQEIKLQIAKNNSNGTPENIIQLIASITGSSYVGYWEHYPASVILSVNGDNVPQNIADIMDRLGAAGVNISAVLSLSGGFEYLALSDVFSIPSAEIVDTNIINEDGSDEHTESDETIGGSFRVYKPVAGGEGFNVLPDIVPVNLNKGANQPYMEGGDEGAEAGSYRYDVYGSGGILPDVYQKNTGNK